MRKHRAVRLFGIAVLALAAIALFGFIFMWLWNWVVPPVIGWHTVTYWQALALLVIGKILFGGFRGGHGRHWSWRRRMRAKWEGMTPEEREKFREAMRQRWGCVPPEWEPKPSDAQR